jgi:hypothetical protein
LIFNDYRTFGTTAKSHKHQLLDFKRKPAFKIQAAFKICRGSKKFRYSFRKDLPLTPVHPSQSAQLGTHPLPILDDDEAGVDEFFQKQNLPM